MDASQVVPRLVRQGTGQEVVRNHVQITVLPGCGDQLAALGALQVPQQADDHMVIGPEDLWALAVVENRRTSS